MHRQNVIDWSVLAAGLLSITLLALWLRPAQAATLGLATAAAIFVSYRVGRHTTPRTEGLSSFDQKLASTLACPAHTGLLAKAIDRLPIGISIYDRAGYNRFLSRQATSLLGYTAVDYYGKHETEIAAMGGLGPTLTSQVLAGQDYVSKRFTHRHVDGRSVNLLGAGKAIREDDGDLLGALITFADASDLIELETARSLMGYVFEQVDEGILVIDTGKQIVHVNTPALKFAGGHERSDLIGRPMEEVLPGNTQRRLYRCVDDGYAEKDYIDPTWHINGAPRTVKTCMRPLINHDGVCLGAVIFFTDITDELALQETTQRTDRLALIGQMAAGMAHEIRNPLTTIRGFAQFLGDKMRTVGCSEGIEFTQLMITEVDRVNALISDFLHLAKPKEATYSSFCVAGWLGHIRNLCESEATRRQIELRIEPVPQGTLHGDRDRLTQLMLNLIDNAFKSCGAGAQVTVRVHEVDSGMLQIDVEDTGCGIPTDCLPLLYDPFFTTREDGTGLGLSICQRIVTDHGGNLGVAATSDQGTTFRVLLP
ncbi:MAG: ATP-binding protein, partial [Bacillota bacterium]